MKVRGLEVDPRDYGKDNPKCLFERKLKVFKKNFIDSGIVDSVSLNNKSR